MTHVPHIQLIRARHRRDLRRALVKCLSLVVALLFAVVVGAGPAVGATVSSESLGINGGTQPDIAMASSYGLGLVRMPVQQGTNVDKAVATLAAAHLRVYPLMGLSSQMTPSAAASAMAQFVTSFAQRYGPGGSFWAQNPQLPKLPVLSYEIGNEPNIPLKWVADSTHLHWTDPSAYAQVYEAARAALHQVDPTGVAAVVGGLVDGGGSGVDLASDEEWLAALTPGTVDAVGYHPYTFFVSPSLMTTDTEALREWMNSRTMGGAPIDINEVGACDVQPQDTENTDCGASISSADWGAFAASLTEWSLCSPAVGVESMQPEYWGDQPDTDVNAVLALVSSKGTLTPYGMDYLGEAEVLATLGCPLVNTSPPSIIGDPVSGLSVSVDPGGWSGAAPTFAYQWQRCDSAGLNCTDIPGATTASYQAKDADVGSTLVVTVTATNPGGSVATWTPPSAAVGPAPSGGSAAGGTSPPARHAPRALLSMRLKLLRVHVHGPTVVLTVRVVPGSGRVQVLARKGHHHLVRLRMIRHNRAHSVLTFTRRLSAGRWTLVVAGKPAAGYRTPKPLRRTVRIRR